MLQFSLFDQPGVEPMVTVRRGVLVWVEPTVLTVVGVGLFILLLGIDILMLLLLLLHLYSAYTHCRWCKIIVCF